MGIEACNLNTYVESFNNAELLDMIDAPTAVPEDFEYETYLNQPQITSGLKQGNLIQGTINTSGYNCFEGSIYTEFKGEMTSIMISGRKNFNRAIHGDVVALEILPKSEWVSESRISKIENDDEDSKVQLDESQLKVSAKVVGVIKRNWRVYCGSIDPNTIGKSDNVLVKPLDRRIPKIRIHTRQSKILANRRILVIVDSWPQTSKYPCGHYSRNLGDIGDKQTETEAILLEHDVSYQKFSQNVLACLPEEGADWKPTEEDYKTRTDFRDLAVCSIDPPGCTDIDDALHVVALPNGNLHVGVHIADVTHFVKPNTAMDEEAQQRGTTVYLVDKRIDMLPELLGTNLCSLKSNVERLAFSCIWEMNHEAEIISTHFTKSIIKSKASYTYDEAQLRIDNPNMNDTLAQNIRMLNQLAKKLKARRIADGALTLSSPEVRFELEGDSDPVDVELKELKEANALVEEFMLLANISVAKETYSKFEEAALLRRHPTPPHENFDLLKKNLQRRGFDLDVSSSKSLADSLNLAVDPDDAYFNKLVRICTTRCMMQAVYFCSGTLAYSEFRHYGLATEIYTHFTSPIRRYSDVIVHRLLSQCIESSESKIRKEYTSEVCENLNLRHRNAQYASRASISLYTSIFFRDKQVEQDAYVIRVLKNGVVVLVPQYGIEGVLHSDEEYDVNDNSISIGGIVRRMFDKCRVFIELSEDRLKIELAKKRKLSTE